MNLNNISNILFLFPKAKQITSLALVLFFLFVSPSFLQSQSLIDSLQNELQKTIADTLRIDIQNDLAWELMFDESEKARSILKEVVTTAQSISYPKGAGQAYNNLGVLESIHERTDTAIIYLEKALEIRQTIGDKKGVASLYTNIGYLKAEQENSAEAFIYFKKSLNIRQELKDTLLMARASYNIAFLHEKRTDYVSALDFALTHLGYAEQLNEPNEILTANNLLGNIKLELERFDEAIDHYEKALAKAQSLDDENELAIIYQNLGNAKADQGSDFFSHKAYDQSIELYEAAKNLYDQSLALYIKMEDGYGEAALYNNIGVVHKDIGSYYLEKNEKENADQSLQLAMDYLQKSLNIRQADEDLNGMMEVYNGMGDVRRRQERIREALVFSKKCLAIADTLSDKKYQQKSYKDLSRVYAALGNYKTAYDYRKAYDELRYEQLDEDRTKQNSHREAIYGDYTKAVEIERQQREIEVQDSNLRYARILRNSLIGGAIALALLAILLYNRYRIKTRTNLALEEKNAIIEEEKQKSDNLLLNILPEETAKELKTHGKTKARHYESVTVLFTDFKSFTQVAELLTPEELVAELDYCFKAYDEITTRHGIEKIKTIGDSYMCAGGLPSPNNSHPQDVVKAALEIQTFMNNLQISRTEAGKKCFEVRIGLHTGPVIAGIVGSKKFAYDIWGDTVNLASRMESSGAPGKVNISATTYELVKNDFHCIPRGKIDAKNKGAVEMFFVESK